MGVGRSVGVGVGAAVGRGVCVGVGVGLGAGEGDAVGVGAAVADGATDAVIAGVLETVGTTVAGGDAAGPIEQPTTDVVAARIASARQARRRIVDR